mmetsp:Transcript_68081/g.192921  ORF Transcript_68081/g.192921 Transcript_68081/m.192921 type:complete len:294 (-) Transcript_68081:721-1602(-)
MAGVAHLAVGAGHASVAPGHGVAVGLVVAFTGGLPDGLAHARAVGLFGAVVKSDSPVAGHLLAARVPVVSFGARGTRARDARHVGLQVVPGGAHHRDALGIGGAVVAAGGLVRLGVAGLARQHARQQAEGAGDATLDRRRIVLEVCAQAAVEGLARGLAARPHPLRLVDACNQRVDGRRPHGVVLTLVRVILVLPDALAAGVRVATDAHSVLLCLGVARVPCFICSGAGLVGSARLYIHFRTTFGGSFILLAALLPGRRVLWRPTRVVMTHALVKPALRDPAIAALGEFLAAL